MKKIMIGTLVGTIIVFLWQWLSWSGLGIHKDAFKYSDKQDMILKDLSQLPEGGLYMMPGMPPNSSSDQMEQNMKDREGKAWASVNYVPEFHANAGKTMLTQLLMNLLCAWIVAWSLMRTSSNLPSFGWRWVASMGFPLFAYLFVDVGRMNWWKTPSHFMTGEILDLFIAWGLAGIWFAWYLGGERKAASTMTEREPAKAAMYE